ncbi:MAG: thermonuclease family protein [Hyphomonadaceae bacterium]|nr:thermonuclease family protein [Hyphomonadaceae bacterium]
MRARSLTTAFLAVFLAACGPQIGELERGEEGRVVRAYNGDTLELDSGLRVFLAEIDAPRGEQAYASQANGELEALALHRDVLLAYGGERRWAPRPREDQTEPPSETAIAHVYVKSEGGRWFWLQHELIARGAAYVRPRRSNHARADELLQIEARARGEERGLWAKPEYQPLSSRAASDAAIASDTNCLRADAPYRIVEGHVAEAAVSGTRAVLTLDGGDEQAPFSLVAFGDNFTAWDGPTLTGLQGQRVRARGPLGVFRDAPQLCLEHSSQLEVLAD